MFFENISITAFLGINCSYPNLVSSFGLKMKQSFPNHTLVAYPNTAENWTNEENKWGETERYRKILG